MTRSRESELEFLREAVRTFAPSWKEGPVIDLLSRVFDGTPFTKDIDPTGNVTFMAGSGKPVLLLASHMDTIDDPLPFHEDEQEIHGRGAVDCRASLLAMALAARRAVLAGAGGTVVVAGIVAEEVSTEGIEGFIADTDISPDFIMFGEPTGTTKICIAYKGRVLVRVSVSTAPGHVAAAWIFDNSLEIAWRFHERLKERVDALTRGKQLSPFYTPRATITACTGGTAPNVMPDRAVIDIDIRFPPGTSKDSIKALVLEVHQEIATAPTTSGEPAGISCSFESTTDGIRVPTSNPLCTTLSAAITAVTAQEARFVKKTGSTFMNQLGNHFTCPIVTYGPGDPSLEHTAGERVDKTGYLQAIDVLERVVLELLG